MLIIETLAFCFLNIFLILLSISLCSFDKGFYQQQFTKLQVAKDLNISEVDCNRMRDCLLDYLLDKKYDLQLEIKRGDVKRQAFNDREVTHMSDVKKLWQKTVIAQKGFFITGVILLIGCYIFDKLVFYSTFLKAYKKAIIILIIFTFVILLKMLLNFDNFWTNFHKIFFTNDLWLLNPDTDLLISLVPPPFFLALLKRIIFLTIFFLLSPLIVVKLLIKEKR